MRTGAALLICMAAGCGGPFGADLEIVADASLGIHHVELFIAEQPCANVDPVSGQSMPCEGGVGFLPGGVRPPGTTYVMKGDEDVISTDVMVDGSFVLNLRAASGFADPQVIGIVGFDANDTPRAVATLWYPHIPLNSEQHWKVKLEAADVATANPFAPPSNGQLTTRVYAWKREGVDAAAKSRCVAIQNWNETTKTWDGTFVVPDTDRDCDGAMPECDDRWYRLNQDIPTTRAVACLTEIPTGTNPMCVVGATACRDGVSADRTCSAATTGGTQLECVPAALCDQCPEPFGLASCLSQSIRKLAQVSHYDCGFAGDATGHACGDGHVGNHVRINVPFPCNNVPDVRPVSAPLTPTGSAQAKLNNNLTTIDVVKASFQPTSPTCNIDLFWSGSMAPGSRAVIVLAFASPMAAKEALVPVELAFSNVATDCTLPAGEPTACTASAELPGDTFLLCAQ